MKTIIIKDLDQFNEATRIIQEGGLVAAPTETVYGLCANALNEVAVGNIFKAKGNCTKRNRNYYGCCRRGWTRTSINNNK